MAITPGENVGPYRIMEQLGSGGMATVFKAYHAALDRYVAIKILHPAFKADPQFFERFKREARIVANLEHPNIIPVYDFNEHHGEPYLVMRYIEGDTLKPHMEGQPLAPEEILRLMRPVCQALAYAHKQGVLHRDIKPSNIMITNDGSIFLTDFGLARMVQAGESTLSQDMMVGTPQYISPEQAQGISSLDGRTDIYSLGVVLFEMLTGQVPFNADTPFATVHDHIYTPLPLPCTINPGLDPAVERVLLKALAKEPEDRYQHADELLNALEGTLGPQVTIASAHTSPVAGLPKKRGLPWWVWAGSATMIVCLLGALLIGLLALRNRNQRPAAPIKEPVSAPVADELPPADLPPPGPPPGRDAPGDAPPPVDQPGRTDSAAHQAAVELTEQGSQALRADQYEEAAGLFEQAVGADPHYLPAYFGLSDTLNQAGDPEGSIAVLEHAVANNPGNIAPLMSLGEAQLFRAENPEAALAAFEEAIALEPESPSPHAGQALALLFLDQDEAAREAIDTALMLDPGSHEAHLANAAYLAKQGNRLRAIEEIQQIIQDRTTPFFVKERARQLLARIRS
jgi:serine/threonine-protein kinase